MNKDLNDETWEREFFIIEAERRKNKKERRKVGLMSEYH